MEGESLESRFVERRSAHLDEEIDGLTSDSEETIVPEPEAPAADLSAAEAAVEEQAGAAPATDLDLEEMARVDIPEPSFYEIVQPLEIQALQFLGELPLTPEGQRAVLPRWAKHVIDLLGILEERTRGNLTPEEAQYLEQVLTDLRLRYVRASA